jgi:hypothetical protein
MLLFGEGGGYLWYRQERDGTIVQATHNGITNNGMTRTGRFQISAQNSSKIEKFVKI